MTSNFEDHFKTKSSQLTISWIIWQKKKFKSTCNWFCQNLIDYCFYCLDKSKVACLSELYLDVLNGVRSEKRYTRKQLLGVVFHRCVVIVQHWFMYSNRVIQRNSRT